MGTATSHPPDDVTTIPDDVFERLARRVLGILIKNDETKRTTVQLSRNNDLAELPANAIDQFFKRSSHLFKWIVSPGDVIAVEAFIDLTVCQEFCSRPKDGCQNATCHSLHYCKFFISNNCTFGKRCHYGHDVTANPHNAPLLRRFFLDGMSSDDVVRLLRASARSRPTTVAAPKICKFYNSRDGCWHDQEGTRCPALHVCRHYIIGDCIHGAECRRSHVLTGPNEVAILQRCGVDVGGQNVEDVLAKLRSVMTLNEDVDNCEPGGARPDMSSAMSPNTMMPSSKATRSASLTASNDKTEKRRQRKKMVCIHHLRGICRYGDSCQNYHSKFGLKYQWQWSDCVSTGQDADGAHKHWQDFDKEKCITIERNFCDVEMEACSVKDQNGDSILIDFNDEVYVRTQDGDTGKIRRLGTQSADNSEMYNRQRFKTLWIWYRKTSTGLLEKYDASDDIEQEYQAENYSWYVSPGNDFTVDLRSMIHHTVQGFDRFPVRRRPVFFDPSSTTSAKASGSAESRTNIPTSWIFDITGNGDPDFQLVPVPNSGSTAKEYQEVAGLFEATMPEPIKSLKRIQNKELWEDFDRTRQRMEKKRSGKGPLIVRRLFHGTRSQYVDAICQQGFDWRVAGMSVGTLYGKGSYFARDAKYSKSYCDGSNKMFIAQVIVGDFTLGKPEYVRPPAKDPSLPIADQQMYDTCVNDMSNPAIFVVFHQSQVYPEYLVEF